MGQSPWQWYKWLIHYENKTISTKSFIHTHSAFMCVQTQVICNVEYWKLLPVLLQGIFFFNSIYYWGIRRGRLSKTTHGTDINDIFSAHYVKDHYKSEFQVPKQHDEKYLSNYLNQNYSCPFIFYVPPILAMKDTCDQWPMKDTCDQIAKIKMTFFCPFIFYVPPTHYER